MGSARRTATAGEVFYLARSPGTGNPGRVTGSSVVCISRVCARRRSTASYAHHVDTGYYDRFYQPGVYTEAHRRHFEIRHHTC